jgi:hypothetical protein
MALAKTVSTPHQFEATNAYHRIGSLHIKNKEKIVFSLTSHKDKDSSSFYSKLFECDYSINGSNPFEQAYKYLKTLPEFDGATDC